MSKKRTYSESYLQFGFTSIEQNGIVIPQCVICHKTLGNDSMKPSLLTRHLEKVHPEFINKDLDFFKYKETVLKKQRLDSGGRIFQQNNAALKASYEVSLLIAKQKKPYTIGEDLVLPAAKTMIRCVLRDECAKKLNTISLSNSTVQRRIEEMSVDILQQVICEICKSEVGFSIQLDESTDITNCAQLLVFARYVGKEGIKEELLMNSALEATTRGEDVFKIVNSFFNQHGLKWEYLKGCTTDGAPAMLGRRSGFKARVLEVAPHAKFMHCMIHRFALACRVLPGELSNVLSLVVKMINHVKHSPLNSRLFKLICDDIGANHSVLLFHSNVRWLSRGNVTKRVYELRRELLEFFQHSNKQEVFVTSLKDDIFLLNLAYLVDIFEAMNTLNQSIQGKDATICEFVPKLKAFIEKLRMWRGNIQSGTLAMFSTVTEFLNEKQQSETDILLIKKLITDHLMKLEEELEGYFPNIGEGELMYLRNPFSANAQLLQPGIGIQEELIELQHDYSARDVYSENNLCDFWFRMLKLNSYKRLAEPAIQALLLFPSTWLCESTFSMLLGIKSKHRSSLKTPEHDIRCAVAKVSPRINDLVAKKQSQPSH